ncbi:MAG TPA: hypothetical protein VK540_24990 [Polyangiaceae bacterium]|nr:hypothetical protein [Polyangiaceae bacterium]
MSRRDVPTLRTGDDDVPEPLQRALDVAADDELPGAGRMNRIEASVLADLALTSGQMPVVRRSDPLGSDSGRARTSGWRAPVKPRIRFAAAKVGIAALAGMGAAWSSVAGYRAYQAATAHVRAEPAASSALPTKQSRRMPAAPTVAPLDEIVSPETPPSLAAAREESVAGSVEGRARITDGAPSPVIAPPAASGASTVALPPVSARSSLGIAAPKPNEGAPTPAVPSATPAPLGDVTSPDTPAPSSTMAPSAARTLEEDLLERATQSLRNDPQKGLALADEHRATFVSGRLAQEREVVAIQALAKLGRFDAARARARQFIAQHPESPYAKDVLTMATGIQRR